MSKPALAPKKTWVGYGASENVTALKAQETDLQTKMQDDLQSVTADWELSNEPFERVLVKPKRGGVSVQLVSLVWVPA